MSNLAIARAIRAVIFSGTIVWSVTAANTYLVHNLVSDLPGLADRVDKNLVNPWGTGFSATSPIWIGNNGTGTSTLYDGVGTPVALVVSIPTASGGTSGGKVSGVIANGNSTAFLVATGRASSFVFCTEDGLITGWNSTVDSTHAKIIVDNSKAGAVYKGCTIANTASGPMLFAANFNSGAIDVWDANLNAIKNAGAFGTSAVPSGFAPFNVEAINGLLYVSYAKQDAAKQRDVFGAGNGYVAVFDTLGNLRSNLVAQGPLNSPWGMAIAPASFGDFANAL